MAAINECWENDIKLMGIENMIAETNIELNDDLMRWQMAFKGVLYF